MACLLARTSYWSSDCELEITESNAAPSIIKSIHLVTTCQDCWKCHECISLLKRIMGFLIGTAVCEKHDVSSV